MLLDRKPGIANFMLYPINKLAEHLPSIAEAKRLKYAGREEVLDRKIPPLGCSWGDVIFLTPAHPNLICKAVAVCMEREVPPIPYYEFSIRDLPCHSLAYWHNNASQYTEAEVEKFDARKYREPEGIPSAQYKYLLQAKRNQEKPLWFSRVPHVFLKGELSVRGYHPHYTQTWKPNRVWVNDR